MTGYLEEHLGRRIPTKELAAWLDLDVDSIRRHYQSFGGIRPIAGGKILFFERNVVDALRGAQHAIENSERRSYPLEGASPETGPDQAETLRHQGRGFGMGGNRKEDGLGSEDRHGLFAPAMGGKVPRSRKGIRQKNLQRQEAGTAGTVRGKDRQGQGSPDDRKPAVPGNKPHAGQGFSSTQSAI